MQIVSGQLYACDWREVELQYKSLGIVFDSFPNLFIYCYSNTKFVVQQLW